MRKLILSLTLGVLTLTGCVTSNQLEEGGAYQGKAVLYNIDVSYKHTRELLTTIFEWESGLPAEVSKDLRPLMNKARVAATKADKEFHQLRNAYLAAPTDANKESYENAFLQLNAVLSEVSSLYMKGK